MENLMAQTATSRKEEILAQLKAKVVPLPEIQSDALKINQIVSPSRMADIDNLLASMNPTPNGTNTSPLRLNIATPTSPKKDMAGSVVFYTSFGGGSIYPTPGNAIKLPYTTNDPAMIAMIKSIYAIGSLTCPIKMKELG
jgi:hypothetical protein